MRLRDLETGARNLGKRPSPAPRRKKELPVGDGLLRRVAAAVEGLAGIKSAVARERETAWGAPAPTLAF